MLLFGVWNAVSVAGVIVPDRGAGQRGQARDSVQPLLFRLERRGGGLDGPVGAVPVLGHQGGFEPSPAHTVPTAVHSVADGQDTPDSAVCAGAASAS